MTFHPDTLPDLKGKVFVVTGGTSGIGYYTVARLAQHGAHVYLCARSEAKGQNAISGIESLYPGSNISTLVMDHTSMSSVVAAANLVLSRERILHGVVNNAGIMAVPYSRTEDGYDISWQTNHMAHWVLTEKLLPLMVETSKTLGPGAVRIVNLTSGGHMMAPKPGINFADTSLSEESAITRYGQSKLANILHAKILHQRYGPSAIRKREFDGEIWTAAVHPGIVETELDGKATEMPWFVRTMSALSTALGGRWPADKGAWTSVFCVASPDMEAGQSGILFERIAKACWMESSKAKDTGLAKELDDWTRAEANKHGWI